jgi:hypothetical protein
MDNEQAYQYVLSIKSKVWRGEAVDPGDYPGVDPAILDEVRKNFEVIVKAERRKDYGK